MLTRRQFLKNTSLLSASTALSSTISYAGDSATLEKIVIEHVKTLSEGKETLTLLHPKGSLANIQPVAAQFTAATGIKINFSEVGVDDINSSIIFSATQNQYTFDIALPATFGIPDLVSAEALHPLSQYTKQYEPSDYKQYQLYDYGDYVNDEFYGYQTDGDTYLMFFNKAMMDDKDNKKRFKEEHGYPLVVPETWDKLDDMIRFFHKPKKSQYGGCLFRVLGYGAWEWWSRFHAKGYFPLSDSLEPQINNDAGIAALQEMIDISQYLHPKTATDGLFENWATYAKGQTFCNIGWGGSQKFFNSNKSSVKGGLYYSPTPGGTFTVNGKEKDVHCPIFNWGWNYVVSSQCPHPEIAYLFTLYACSPVMSTLSVQQDGFFDPFREEHYDDKAIQNAYSINFLKAHQLSMEESIPDFYLQSQSSYLSSLQENIHLAYKGSLTAKQALDITATEWKIINNRVGKEKQKNNWRELKNKYPSPLKNILI